MDLVKKMVEATEAMIVAETSFTKLDVSLGDVTNERPNFSKGFSVRPTTLAQQEGGVGFIFFQQGFEIALYDKLAHRGAARDKVFELYEELEKIIKKLYGVRVIGDGYSVLNIVDVQGEAPEYSDYYVSLTISFGAYYRRRNDERG